MKRVLRYLIVVSVTLAVVCAGILLPSRITGWQDAQIIGKMTVEPMETSTAGYRHQLSIIEKIQLISGEQRNTIAIPLDPGREMDAAGAIADCVREIGILENAGVLPELNATDDMVYVTSVNYYLSTVSPSQYVILWVMSAKIEDVYTAFYLDNETGKILGFTIETYQETPVTMFAEETGAVWGAYLGLDFMNIENVPGKVPRDKDAVMQYFFAVYQDENETINYPITINENDRMFGNIMLVGINSRESVIDLYD